MGHTEHAGQMRISSVPFVPKKLKGSNRQDMVFIRPPGISEGAFQLRMDNIWFCKLLLLFKIHTRTDTGMQYRECAYVSVLEEYTGPRKPGHILHIMHIMHILNWVNHSVGWTVSICNDLRAPWASTSLVCDSSILHSGTPSSSPYGCNQDNTLCHATRISRLSWSIMLQISEQWWWM